MKASAFLQFLKSFGPKLITAWPLIVQLIGLVADSDSVGLSAKEGFSATEDFHECVEYCEQAGVPAHEARALCSHAIKE